MRFSGSGRTDGVVAAHLGESRRATLDEGAAQPGGPTRKRVGGAQPGAERLLNSSR